MLAMVVTLAMLTDARVYSLVCEHEAARPNDCPMLLLCSPHTVILPPPPLSHFNIKIKIKIRHLHLKRKALRACARQGVL